MEGTVKDQLMVTLMAALEARDTYRDVQPATMALKIVLHTHQGTLKIFSNETLSPLPLVDLRHPLI
jgi:hypothetical protein